MPKLNQVRCVLAVKDHRKSADFCRQKLGFNSTLKSRDDFSSLSRPL